MAEKKHKGDLEQEGGVFPSVDGFVETPDNHENVDWHVTHRETDHNHS